MTSLSESPIIDRNRELALIRVLSRMAQVLLQAEAAPPEHTKAAPLETGAAEGVVR
jgi:hypothetical protein